MGNLVDMAAAVQECVRKTALAWCASLAGHGIGLDFHEDPFVGFTVESPDVDTLLVPGMCFTIEPMVNAGAPDIFIDEKTVGSFTPKTAQILPSGKYSLSSPKMATSC